MLAAAKEIDISKKVDKKNLLFTPVERMVEVYNKINDDEKKEKSLETKTFFIEIYYKLLNNYKKYGGAIIECEEENIKKLINLNDFKKEVTYTEKEEFLMNLYLDYTSDRRENDDDDDDIKKFNDFPIQTQIKEMAELENEYYKIRPKKYIERSLSDEYQLKISYC